MSLDMALWLTGLSTELVVIALMLRRRIALLLPVFFAYMAWTLLSDVTGLFIRSRFPGAFFPWFRIEMPLDAAFQLCVVMELAWSVLRPYRNALPRYTIYVLGGVILALAGLIWPLAGVATSSDLPAQWHTLLRFQQTAAILRILFFLILAGFSQLLAIGWRNRELQVASGLGFYSVVSLGGALLHAQLAGTAHYHLIDQLVAASFAACLIYWIISFMQKEAPRQDFSPRMQHMLLALAGTARAQRMELQDMQRNRKP